MLRLLNATAVIAALAAIALLAFAAWATHFEPGMLSRADASHMIGAASFLSAFVALEGVCEGQIRARARKTAECEHIWR